MMLPLPWEQAHPYEAVGTRTQAWPGKHRWGSSAQTAMVVLGALLCSAGLWVAVWSDVPMGRAAELADVRESIAPMKVMVTNSYQRDDAVSELKLYPWEHVAEPMRETRLEIRSWPGRDRSANEVEYTWRVEGQIIGAGEETNTVFASPGTYKCSVSAAHLKSEGGGDEEGQPGDNGGGDRVVNGSGEEGTAETSSVHRTGIRFGDGHGRGSDGPAGGAGVSRPGRRLDFEVTVKYVRREIRSLTDRDRETFFNAMAVMQRVPSAAGREVYGNKYYSKDYFNRIHLYYGGRKGCNHFHAGAGFVNAHVAISLMFEQSLQAINPSIALPYWDFTIEGTYYDWSNFRNSSVFSDDWFGAAAPKNDMRTPTRGRFGYVPVMMNATDYSNIYNSYGMLRSPWNNDPTPFLTRSDHLMGFLNHRKPSGCRKYRDAMMQTTWMSLTESFNEGAHGELHELLGGAWSTEAQAYAERTSPKVQPFVHVAVPLMKMLWRAGYIGCPDFCTMDVPWEKCRCTCSDGILNGEASWEILEKSGVLEAGFFYDRDAVLINNLVNEEGNAYVTIPGYTREETRDIYDEMLLSLCTPIRLGTHYGAASTKSFWVIHPTFDRLWHLQRLEANEDFDQTWIADNPCYGHNPDDIMPFHNLFLEDTIGKEEHEQHEHSGGEVAKTYYTNSQLYVMLRPDAMEIPYVYDNFQWTHCDEQGIFIRGKQKANAN